VLLGALRNQNETGGWQVGDVDLSEHLDKYRGREVLLIIASVGKAGGKKVTCGVCGFAMDGVSEGPRCKMITERQREISRNGKRCERRFLERWRRFWGMGTSERRLLSAYS
jgi:hypothetical protein